MYRWLAALLCLFPVLNTAEVSDTEEEMTVDPVTETQQIPSDEYWSKILLQIDELKNILVDIRFAIHLEKSFALFGVFVSKLQELDFLFQTNVGKLFEVHNATIILQRLQEYETNFSLLCAKVQTSMRMRKIVSHSINAAKLKEDFDAKGLEEDFKEDYYDKMMFHKQEVLSIFEVMTRENQKVPTAEYTYYHGSIQDILDFFTDNIPAASGNDI